MGIPGGPLTQSEAVAVAHQIAVEHGWPWLLPVSARRVRPWFFGKPQWVIHTNAESLGMNVHVVLDDGNGAVLEKGFSPR
jgi:hypothetical protein